MKATKKAKAKPAKAPQAEKSFHKLLPLALIVITAAVYYTSLNNGFTNWDDPANVTQNADIRAFHGDSIGYTMNRIFSVRNDMNMYAPLTNLSYCLQYAQSQLHPWPYHFVNLFLHILNGLLVFWLVWLISRKQWLAFITALLFAIHPMHVESVAWVTGRIDVLYSFFYLLALCTYLLSFKSEKWKWQFYILTFILFVLAVLSKAAAVTLPVVLLALDYLLNRKIDLRNVASKAPFFIVSLIFGYLTIYVQTGIASIEDFVHYNFFDKFLFSCYALVMYMWKLIAPVNLSCCYNYPAKLPSSMLSGQSMYPFIFYLSPIIVAVIAFLVYKSLKQGRSILFGVAFFLINVALVLPGFASRNTIIADRYTYISYIGLFFILAGWIENLRKREAFKIPVVSATVLFFAWCAYLTVQRCEVWHDSISLWTDAIAFNTDYVLARDQRASAYEDSSRNEEAISDYNISLKLMPYDDQALFGRAVAYNNLGRHEDALRDYTELIKFKPKLPRAYNNRGNVYGALKKYREAINDFNVALSLSPGFADAYNNRGNAHCMLQEYEEGIKDYGSAIQIDPNSVDAYRNRAITYVNLQKYQLALNDAKKVKQLGQDIAPAYIEMIEEHIRNGK